MDSSFVNMGSTIEGKKGYANENGLHSFWDCAPEELIARILALLPCSNIYLARGVCKRWKSIIWSPLFLSLCKLWQHPRKPWLLEFQQQMYNQAWAYDLHGCQWFHVNFSFLPENAILMATSGGLVCLGRIDREGYVLFICNPLTKDWKRLPPIPLQPGVVLLDVDHQSSIYKVVALVLPGQARNARPTGSVFVFDAKIGVWRETIGVPWELNSSGLWDAAVSGGVLYCLTTQQRMEVYDLDTGVWSPRAVSHGPSALPVIVNQQQHNRHRLQLADNLSSDMSYIFNWEGKWGAVMPDRGKKAMVVFEFDASASCWRSGYPAQSIVCAGRFSSLCSSTLQDGWEVYHLHAEGNKCYSSTSRSCSLLPRSPLTRHKIHGNEILVRGLWFEPRIEVTT